MLQTIRENFPILFAGFVVFGLPFLALLSFCASAFNKLSPEARRRAAINS